MLSYIKTGWEPSPCMLSIRITTPRRSNHVQGIGNNIFLVGVSSSRYFLGFVPTEIRGRRGARAWQEPRVHREKIPVQSQRGRLCGRRHDFFGGAEVTAYTDGLVLCKFILAVCGHLDTVLASASLAIHCYLPAVNVTTIRRSLEVGRTWPTDVCTSNVHKKLQLRPEVPNWSYWWIRTWKLGLRISQRLA
jgi:hypothetical protein